jgi:hypothetical protein
MNSEEIRLDLLAIEDFRDRLGPRLPHVVSALSTLARVDGPALGHFHHARLVERRYADLHADFMARMRRLRTALVVAQAGTSSIADLYRLDREHFRARLDAISEALTHADGPRRAAVLRAAWLDATLFQDAARYEAMVLATTRRELSGESTVVGGGRSGA